MHDLKPALRDHPVAMAFEEKPATFLRLWWPRQMEVATAPVYLLGSIFQSERKPDRAPSFEIVVVCSCPPHALPSEVRRIINLAA